jgi:hypothetical protein
MARIKWTNAMLAYLEFLVSLGLDARTISNDPLIATTPNNIHRLINRLGGSLRRSRSR